MILLPVIVALGAVMYALTVASFAWEDLVFGAGLTVVLLALFRAVVLPRPLPSSGQVLIAIVAFPLFTLAAIRDIFKGTWLVARHVVGLRPLEHPGIVRIPLGKRASVSRGLAGYVITLSPGTFLIDVDEETDEMLVHAIDASDPDALRHAYQAFHQRYERHVVPPLPKEPRR
jgi:multisubunit Na+/H+ antiporter MnhE subunit